jgi:hypothetical protein
LIISLLDDRSCSFTWSRKLTGLVANFWWGMWI